MLYPAQAASLCHFLLPYSVAGCLPQQPLASLLLGCVGKGREGKMDVGHCGLYTKDLCLMLEKDGV